RPAAAARAGAGARRQGESPLRLGAAHGGRGARAASTDRRRRHGLAVARPRVRGRRDLRRLAARGNGAPAVDVRRGTMNGYRAGVDIGGTKTAAVALTADGAIAHEVRLPTGFGAASVLATAERAVRDLAGLAGIDA